MCSKIERRKFGDQGFLASMRVVDFTEGFACLMAGLALLSPIAISFALGIDLEEGAARRP